jgi:hypothetical protein
VKSVLENFRAFQAAIKGVQERCPHGRGLRLGLGGAVCADCGAMIAPFEKQLVDTRAKPGHDDSKKGSSAHG